jgi:hypothetical protein
MSVNRNRPHVFVLPEDDANQRLAIGFLESLRSTRQMQVLPVAGGWHRVLDTFERYLDLKRFPERFVVLLIDFDNKQDRLPAVKERVPGHLTDRVFVLGVLSNPEDLRRALGKDFEEIGSALAKDCREGTDTVWDHKLLRHNADEVARLREHVRPFLFA